MKHEPFDGKVYREGQRVFITIPPGIKQIVVNIEMTSERTKEERRKDTLAELLEVDEWHN